MFLTYNCERSVAIQTGPCIEEGASLSFYKLRPGLPRRFVPRNDGGRLIYPTTQLMTVHGNDGRSRYMW